MMAQGLPEEFFHEVAAGLIGMRQSVAGLAGWLRERLQAFGRESEERRRHHSIRRHG